MGNKLELTWYGKEVLLKIESRLLIENLNLSYGYENDGITDNMLKMFNIMKSWKISWSVGNMIMTLSRYFPL